MSTTASAYPSSGGSSDRRTTLAALWFAGLASLVFIIVAAVPYFVYVTEAQYRDFWPRRGWLLFHIATGIAALLAGPVQIWLGLTNQRPMLHRRLGFIYLACVGTSSLAAYYLAFCTSGGWVFAAGISGLATAWLTTTGLAFVAIRRQAYDQHKEWMIRSYVVTTAFVSFRVLAAGLSVAGVGTIPEQLAAASWFCWAVPLLVTEAVLQGRKIVGAR